MSARTRPSVRSGLFAGLLWAAFTFAHGAETVEIPDALPSWNDGPARQAIVRFVARVAGEGSPEYVAPAERIAVFDNDGTLWAEQPVYVQLAFTLDRVKALAPQHPEWRSQEPFASALKGDLRGALAGGEPGVAELIVATHGGMTTEEFDRVVRDWMATARHPKTGRAYTAMVYQPMLELLAYLRANGFKTFIVSGGGADFMRAWAETVYGIPPEQVIGSTGETRFELIGQTRALRRLGEGEFVDDKDGKPIGIHRFIGRRPILAFGNSDGDQQMLEWTAGGSGARFMAIVRHTDAAREFEYDRASPIGRLDKALDEGTARGWTIVSMKDDWKTVYPAPPAR